MGKCLAMIPGTRERSHWNIPKARTVAMKNLNKLTRRNFIKTSSALFGAAAFSKLADSAVGFETPNERPTIGVVGCGSRWDHEATSYGVRYGSAKPFTKFQAILYLYGRANCISGSA